MPGRYLLNMPGDPTNLDFLSEQIQNVGQAYLGKKMKKQQRQQQMQDQIRQEIIRNILGGKGQFTGQDVNMEDLMQGQFPPLNTYEPITTPSTSMSVSPYSFEDKLKAQQMMGATPQSLYDDPEKRQFTEKYGGFMGLGSKARFTPEFEAMRGEAEKVVSGPGKISYKQTGKFSGKPFFTKEEKFEAEDADIVEDMPDPSLYEEDTIIQDDVTGSKYQLKNGKWIKI